MSTTKNVRIVGGGESQIQVQKIFFFLAGRREAVGCFVDLEVDFA